jgi:hypothetical protein
MAPAEAARQANLALDRAWAGEEAAGPGAPGGE